MRMYDHMKSQATKRINLALQGGGSHGAFTWGVLDHLLDDNRLDIESIAGVSSGAINATLLASGFLEGGRSHAKTLLAEFWHAVSKQYRNLFETNPSMIWGKVVGMDYHPSFDPFLSITQSFSPYQLNPFNLNPLRRILNELVDFHALRKHSPMQLHIGTTQIRTGKMRVFTTDEISQDVLLASACLPSLHHAIKIDGEHYWDGGYSGNPPLFPLIFNSDVNDIVVVVLQPLSRDQLPTTADEIRKRSNELLFTNTFLREMRAIALSKEHIKKDWLYAGALEKKMRRLNIHMIEDNKFEQMDGNSRYTAESKFINTLHSQGQEISTDWLKQNYRNISRRSSIDLLKLFA